jgi:hypothetical protein
MGIHETVPANIETALVTTPHYESWCFVTRYPFYNHKPSHLKNMCKEAGTRN